MKTLNFDFNLLGLDGKPLIPAAHAGQFLGSALANSSKGDVLKLFGWSVELYKKRPIQVDKSDEKLLKEFIENNEQMTILAKAQLLEAFETPVSYPTLPE